MLHVIEADKIKTINLLLVKLGVRRNRGNALDWPTHFIRSRAYRKASTSSAALPGRSSFCCRAAKWTGCRVGPVHFRRRLLEFSPSPTNPRDSAARLQFHAPNEMMAHPLQAVDREIIDRRNLRKPSTLRQHDAL